MNIYFRNTNDFDLIITINVFFSPKVLLLTHSGSVQSQREVRWYVPPVPLSQEKQSMASRSTWRFARRFVDVPEWEHQNKKKKQKTLCSQTLLSFLLHVCINDDGRSYLK